MRDDFIAGRDCNLEFHAGGSQVPRMQTLAYNPFISYLSDNIRFTIPYEKLRIIFSDINVLLSSLYTFANAKASESSALLHDHDYHLDFDALWGIFNEELHTIYTNLYEALSSIERDDETKPFLVKFFMEEGAGFIRKSTLNSQTYTQTSLDFDEFQFPFDPSDSDEVHKAVQSIILYTFFLPGVVACVYESAQKMISGMDMTHIYTVEELREVSLTNPDDKFRSRSSDLFVPQDKLADLEGSLFKPGEIPFFLMFNPPEVDVSGGLLPHGRMDHSMRKQMLQYCTFKYIKFLIEGEYDLQIEDLTGNQYITMNNVYVAPGTIIYNELRKA